MELYDFQKKCAQDIIQGFKDHKTQCLAWYTGAGKTNIIAWICGQLIKKDPSVKIGISAYLTTEIKDQIAHRLEEFDLGPRTQKIVYGTPVDNSKNIFVFNPQTINRRLDTFKFKFDFLFIDESHAGLNESALMIPKILNLLCSGTSRILLVSATPWDTLALKRFKGAPVHKRPLDLGIKDGLITDFKFHAEEAMITFEEKDFTRVGDISTVATSRQMAILKSSCLGKFEYICANYSEEIGNKCIVICPPGNHSEVARTFAERYSNGIAFIENHNFSEISIEHWQNTTNNLKRFKTDPKIKFLFVTHKCQVGFDMVELSSIIDLTMSRNIRMLAQRCGRIARKNGTQEKHYFYIYDQSLLKDRLEWLIATMIDFCLGAYDGWTTKSAKYKKTHIKTWGYRYPFSITLNEVVAALKNDELIHNKETLIYLVSNGPPKKWILSGAITEAKKYSSRTEMWKSHPGLYKWFRLNAKDEMERIFPYRHRFDKWDEKSVIRAMKKASSRKSFNQEFSGAASWLRKNKVQHLREKYLPEAKIVHKWNEESVMALLGRLNSWSKIKAYPGARRWMVTNGSQKLWKRRFLALKGLT